MARFIILTFAMLAWAFWEMSGGAAFEPESRATAEAAAAPAVEEELVTRASSMSTSLSLDADMTPRPTAASLADPVPAPAPAIETASAEIVPEADPAPEEEVVLFDSLVEGAPTSADILPQSQIAVTRFDGSVQRASSAAVSGQIRQVSGARVNMRAGPGTGYGVVVTLPRGTDVEVFEVNDDGWARLRNVATGQEGWMAERLLSGG